MSNYDWMAGSSPARTGEREFANVFMDSSASENMRIIKIRDDGGDPFACAASSVFRQQF